MNKIVFKISKNILIADIYQSDINENLNNTNIINTKEIYFSVDYISHNLDLVSSFLNVIIIKNKLNKVVVKNKDIILYTLDIINRIPSITELDIKPDIVINYEIFLKLLDNSNLVSLNIFDIPNYLLERLDINKSLNINLRCERLFISNFMEINNLNTYSDLYYKKSIVINKFNNDDYNDLVTFLKINKYLKLIEFTYFDKDIFENILNEILKLDITNLKIVFNESYINIKNVYSFISKYKNKKEKVLKLKNINFKINYSENYKKNNVIKQLNLNIIKGILIVTIITILWIMGINAYRDFIDTKKTYDIENDIKDIIHKVNNEKEITTKKVEYISPDEDDLQIINSTTTNIYDIQYKMVFNELIGINKDTVGWLKVNNTNIDYPVVLGLDNDYYLNHDYYQNKNRHGWIFMDYRNSVNNLSRNTIIYGHNLSNQKMFGTLRYVLNSAWVNKASNQIITFNSIYQNMNFQIFSIYKIEATNDYITTNFASDLDYLAFLELIKARSIYDFQVDLNVNDKILTLSTCSNGSKERLVVHAKLIIE